MKESSLIVLLGLASLVAIAAACLIGSTPMGLARIFAVLSGSGSAGDTIVLWQIRLPRALAAFVVGAVLGMSGAALQGLLRNPLAEPGVLGVSSCAALGAAFVLNYGLLDNNALLLPFAAIGGALAATCILAFAAVRISSTVTLILIGVGLSSFATAMIALLMNLAPNPFTLADMINWMLGSVANRSFEDILRAGPFLLAGVVCLLYTRRGLSALTLGEEAAIGVGVNLPRVRTLTVIGAGVCTGAAVSIAGAIGFVGIVAPHMVRPWVGHDPASTLLPSALLAGLLLVLADIGVRLISTNVEMNLGVVVALIGAPAFVWIASRRGLG